MSGTSLDGIDAALVDIVPEGETYRLRTQAALTVPFEHELANKIHAAVAPGAPPPREVAALDKLVGAALGDAAQAVAGGTLAGFVASHGLTLYHDGDASLTWQLGDPFVLRERTGATVLYDFRRADCALGGSGAPLVPYADALLFGSPERFRVALNLGGIANVTLLEPGAGPERARAWDVGPANMLLDAFVRRKTGGQDKYDRDGRFTADGTVDETALAALRGDAYFAAPPPKSTGRERFGDAFMAAHAGIFDRLSLEHGCATLVELTAVTVADAVAACADEGDLIVAGGGAANPQLMGALARNLPHFTCMTSERFGIDPAFKEAVAFTILGYELLRGRPAGLPRVTGARRPALLGAIVPSGLDGVLARIREEVGTGK